MNDAILADKKLAIGNGALYTNIFPLMHTGNLYDHWRATKNQKRVFILTRSAFLGQQRNAAVTWSGDVYSTFLAFQRQVPAGLNFAVSGLPYWTPILPDTHHRATREIRRFRNCTRAGINSALFAPSFARMAIPATTRMKSSLTVR